MTPPFNKLQPDYHSTSITRYAIINWLRKYVFWKKLKKFPPPYKISPVFIRSLVWSKTRRFINLQCKHYRPSYRQILFILNELLAFSGETTLDTVPNLLIQTWMKLETSKKGYKIPPLSSLLFVKKKTKKKRNPFTPIKVFFIGSRIKTVGEIKDSLKRIRIEGKLNS